MSETPQFLGIVSGERRRAHAEVADRSDRIASGLAKLGVKPGDCVCMLMRNDIAFLEAAYAAMRLGAYGVPINWHFKPEEINYILEDSRASVLIGHADLLHGLRDAIPKGVTVLSVPTPPEIRSTYKIDPDHLTTPDFAIGLESWLAQHRPYDGPVVPQPYGSTESSAVTFATSEDALKKPGTVGRISPGAELRFIGEDGRVLGVGEIGEIYSRMAEMADFTYHNKPEKRAEIDRDGFITSGDVGYIDEDGYVFICDRKRDMVISGGVNIYPAEIESVLHAVPGVHDCAVFGIPDAEFGEALMAVVEPQAGVTLEAAGVRAALKAHLADYKVPRHIEIRTGLPREDSGKIFKRRLRDPYWEQVGRKI
ncbi:acyl-CoA synthetase (AMP-forming)/AMP-acid ligase II [Bradyrhizobium liaoningense]